MPLTAVLIAAPEGGYITNNPETGTTSRGQTVEEALTNLREATELYLVSQIRSSPDHAGVTGAL
jgi:predicted RNase H-like HicB family nuclease